MSRSSVALAATLAAACLFGAAPVRADAPPVVLMLDPERRVELSDALRLELAGRDVEVLVVDPPEGATPLARAAAAQAGARFVGGIAAIYLERSAQDAATVRAVGPDGDLVRHAPLPKPVDEVDPGVFAVVAHSLVEELLGPPETPVTVHVHVSVDAPGREVTGEGRMTGRALEQDIHLGGESAGAMDDAGEEEAIEPTGPPAAPEPPPAPPLVPSPYPVVQSAAPQADSGELDDDSPLLPRDGLLVEGGGVFAGVGGGAQLGLGWQLAEQLRLSALTSVVWIFDGSTAYMPALELARIGPGRSGRFDFGVGLGLVFIDGEYVVSPDEIYDVVRVGWVAQAFAGWTWELGDVGIGVRGALAVAGIENDGPIIAPMATLHAEVPL